jgi:hypothetical protein
MLPLLFSIAFLLSCPTLAADRTLAAEGDYVSQSNPNKPLAHWKLWRLRNGEYEVQETLAGPTYVMQVFHFDSQFLPNGFSLTIDTERKRPKALRSKAPWKSYPTIVSCRYTLQDLTCEGENNGKKSASSIVPQQPYVFVPGDFYALDQIWLMTGVVHLTEHNHSENTAVNVYTTYCAPDKPERDLKAVKPWTDARICSARPIQLTYAGKQTASLLGKAQTVTEYEVWNAGREPGAWVLNEFSVLRVTSQGLVAGIHGKSNPELGYAISNYKEYGPWLPSR